MSLDEKALLHRMEQLESRVEATKQLELRVEAMEHQLQEQRQKLEKVERQGQSALQSHSQQQYHEALCSVKGCHLLAVATCEHGVNGIFSNPCGRQICIRHVIKRSGGFGNGAGPKEYCPMHA